LQKLNRNLAIHNFLGLAFPAFIGGFCFYRYIYTMEQIEQKTNDAIFESDFTQRPKNSSDLQEHIESYSQLKEPILMAIMLTELKLMNRKVSKITFILSTVFTISIIGISIGVIYYLFKTLV